MVKPLLNPQLPEDDRHQSENRFGKINPPSAMHAKNLNWIAFIISGCLLPGSLSAAPAPVNSATPIVDSTYVLRANDSINLTVYQEGELSGPVRILKTGQASFPLIGSFQISGMTVAEAAKKIHDLYISERMLVDPKITLTVDSYATEFVSILGSVRSPGQVAIPLSGKLDLASAMASVGGISEDADSSSIRLFRISGATETYSMASIDGGSGRIALNSGDRIIVKKSDFIGKKFTVEGAVGKTGPIQFPLDGKLDLVTAIAYAGGMTEMANKKKVTINRRGRVLEVNYKEVSERGDRPYPIEPGDVIKVIERIW